MFRFRVIETVCLVFVTIVGVQVEVSHDLHLFGENVKNVFLKQCVADSFNRFQVKLLSEGIQNCVLVGESSLFSQSVKIELPSAQATTRTL
ncbi:hypothetical protein C489_18736 [Natrinema versiforme JCM 10478]|uniref:Uncharacterized protein n=1 Tax=Natrinema versiforme JCM 10478 TaxID=1227496 RepID=L9XPM4_9EURY|nr:hypothetical protein C489_18736 [Natrinema versiforme JCM 10478]